MATVQDRTYDSLYDPIHKYQFGDLKDELDSILQYIQNAPNYPLYKIQQCLPNTPVLCTYDPMVWLPPELLNRLLLYLDPASCLTLLSVSKSWNRYLMRHFIWHSVRHQLGVPDSHFQSLGCPLKDSSHPSWMTVIRATLDLQNKLQTKDKFFLRKAIPVQEATGMSLTGPYQLTASKGLICQYSSDKWVVYDMTSEEVLSRYSADVDHRGKITCVRYVDTSNAPNYRPEGIILYGTATGDVVAALPFTGDTSYTEKIFPFHSGSVFCCDADAELDILVSAAADGSVIVWCLSTATLLFAENTDFDVREVHIFPVRDEMYNIIAYGVENCIRYQWPSKITEQMLKRRRDSLLRGFSVFGQRSPEVLKRFGDFLSLSIDELLTEEIAVVKLALKANYTIGCLHVSPNEKSNKILVYDAGTLTLLQSAETSLKIVRFEAVGRRFALFTTTSWGLLNHSIQPSFREEALVLFDLVTAQHLNYIVLPCQDASCYTIALRRCTTYDTSWLDSLPVGAVLTHDWFQSSCASTDDHQEEGDLSDSCSSLSSLSEADDAVVPSQSLVSESKGAMYHSLVYRPRPKSPVLYVTYSQGEITVVTWQLAPEIKPKPNKAKQE